MGCVNNAKRVYNIPFPFLMMKEMFTAKISFNSKEHTVRQGKAGPQMTDSTAILAATLPYKLGENIPRVCSGRRGIDRK